MLKTKLSHLKQRKKEKKQAKATAPKVLKQTHSLLPFLKIEEDYIQLKDGYMDILQIRTKDLYAMNDTDLNILMLNETKMLRSFGDAFKEVVLNFPSNVEKQRRYWLKKKEQTNDPFRLSYIERKLFEFDFIERERTNREYFVFLYAKTQDALEQKRQSMTRARQNSFPLMKLSKKKKQDVLFLLNNQSTKLQ